MSAPTNTAPPQWTETEATGAASPGRPHWIDDWRPEDPEFWATTGRKVAARNLVLSIFSEHIGFSIWSLWSVFVLFLGPKYHFNPGQKFLLTTVPTAVGSALRLPYTLAVAKFGGRNWTVVSAALLVIPCVLAGMVLHPGVHFSTLLLVAAVAGVGGGNFASSMANIDAFYPEHRKGWALGLNAGGGNLGVAAVQLVGLAVLSTAGRAHPRMLLTIYLPLVVVAAVAASWGMDNLSHVRNDRHALRQVCRYPETWTISLLYIGTFGSFIGFSFAFGQVLQVQFAHQFATPIKAASLTFLGPLLGSLFRPVGGRLADRFGGALITLLTFVAMAAGAAAALVASSRHSLPLFLGAFVALFVLSGLGNGSTYKMIPAVFAARARQAVAQGEPPAAEDRNARRMSRALIGLAGAVGALGGVLVNLAFRQSFLAYKSGTGAYAGFVAFYAVCVVVTLVAYMRPARRQEGL